MFTVNESALVAPEQSDKYRKAYFAMGCFWGSEAMLGSADGVISTQVGFSGGQFPNPSYSAIGDHVETVEVTYDPQKIAYTELLNHFWKNHNARAKPIFRQYASAIFCAEQDEMETAKTSRQTWQEQLGQEKILTAVLALDKFYPADEAHQKHYLQMDETLLKGLPAGEHRLYTTLATKLNAVSARAGEREIIEATLTNLGVEAKAQDLLFKRAVWK